MIVQGICVLLTHQHSDAGCVVNDEAATEFLRELVATPSPSGDESDAARVVTRYLEDAGFHAHVDGVGNAVAEIGETGPLVLLLGHLDPVLPMLPVREKDGLLYGRGTV